MMLKDPVQAIMQFDPERAADLIEDLLKKQGSVSALFREVPEGMQGVISGAAEAGLEHILRELNSHRGCGRCAMASVVFLSMVHGAMLAQDAAAREEMAAEIGASDGLS